MAAMIKFARPDGQTVPGYLVEPAKEAPGVVVIQEWWGLNDQIKKTGERLAAAGFRALVPDLFRGKVTKDAKEANHLMTGLDWDGAVQDIRGALQHLEAKGSKAGVLGFCMGGALAIIAAAKVAEAHAAVCFYGIPPAGAADPAKIRTPLQCHFATDDEWCTPAAVSGLEQKLEAGKVDYRLFRYAGTKHAFFNEARPEVYDRTAAELAFQRSVDFLREHLA
jgi:carboxymethylenebutenolidase